MNVADKLVEILVQAGIKFIYGVTGNNLAYLMDAVRKNGHITWIQVRHEEAAALAAEAAGRLNGIGCCAAGSGPGHIHLINGLYNAHRSRVPVLAIAGTIPTHHFGTGAQQETNTFQLFDGCSHYNQMATTPLQAPFMLKMALQAATGKKGVGVLALPGDIGKMTDECDTSPWNLHHHETVLTPSYQQLKALANLLEETDKITIYCGLEAAGAAEEIIRLAEILKAPVAFSFRLIMELRDENPFAVGTTGLMGLLELSSATKSIREAGVLLLLGGPYPCKGLFPAGTKIVSISETPDKLNLQGEDVLSLTGHVKNTLRQLLELLNAKQNETYLNDQLKGYRQVQQKIAGSLLNKGVEDRINPEYITSLINWMAADDGIFTVDTGMTMVWLLRHLQWAGKRSLIGSFDYGTMANALPQAIGAAFASPEREVYAMCGDGGITMLLGELITIAQYNLPVKIFVYNNRGWGMVRYEMEDMGVPDWNNDLLNPDFAQLATAIGIKSFTIRDPGEVASVLGSVFTESGPLLVDMYTDPDHQPKKY